MFLLPIENPDALRRMILMEVSMTAAERVEHQN